MDHCNAADVSNETLNNEKNNKNKSNKVSSNLPPMYVHSRHTGQFNSFLLS